jgi:hypothetical protein
MSTRREDDIDEAPRAPHDVNHSRPIAPEPTILSPTVPESGDAASPPLESGMPRASPVEGDVAGEDTAGAVSELSPMAPPTAIEIAPAGASAPSVGGPHIDLIPPRVRPVEANIALKNMQGRWLLDPDLAPQPPWIGKLSFVFSLTAVVGFGAAALALPNGVRDPPGGIAAAETPLNLSPSEPPIQLARLLVQSQHGFINEPVPLGISLADASGGESLTLLGLVAGTRLSAGTPLGATVWQLSARELGSTLAYAPNDFVGVMDAVIDLRSASGQPMDVQVVRLEWVRKEEERFTPQLDPWVRKEEERFTPQLDPSKSPSAIQPLDSEEIAFLMKRGEDFLTAGDIAAAQIFLKRAANAGSPQAALKVGMTFDPIFLGQNGVLGLAPDAAMAREWYTKAMKLGSTEAPRHLERLGDRGK